MTDNKHSDEEIYKIVPPDNSWSWVVCATSFLMLFIIDGLLFSFTIFYEELAMDFKTTKGKIAAANSYTCFFYSLAGIIGIVLLNVFQFRIIGILGGVLSVGGYLLSSFFSYNYIGLYFLLGFISGLGFGLIFFVANVILLYYFEKRKAVATGISSSGSGFGTIALPPIVSFLKVKFGWRKCFRIISGILGLDCLLAVLYLPLEPVLVSDSENLKSKPKFSCLFMRDKRLMSKLNYGNKSFSKVFIKIIDYRLLKSPAFLVFLLSGLTLNGEYMGIYLFIVDRAKWLGIQENIAIYLLSFFGLTCSFGRICFGIIQDYQRIDNIIISAILFVISGLLSLMASFQFSSNIYVQFTLLGLTGFCLGPYCMRAVIIADLFGMEYLTNAFGINMLAMGIGVFSINYAFSAIYDLTNSYVWIYSINFVISLITCALYLLLRPIRTWEKKKGILVNETIT